MDNNKRLSCISSGTLGALFVVVSMPALAASICGPGDHWVDTCIAGTATYQVQMQFGLDTNVDGQTDVETAFDGTMTVKWSNPFASDSTNPTHMDIMGSQILSMSLTGTGGYVDGWTIRAGIDQSLPATTGYILESADPAVAENRYNMVFNIDGTPFGTLHHTGTFFFTTNITGFPQVGADYKHLGGPFGTSFALYDQSDNYALTITDLFNSDHATVGRPNFVVTAIVPLPSTLQLLMSGLIPMIVAMKSRRLPTIQSI